MCLSHVFRDCWQKFPLQHLHKLKLRSSPDIEAMASPSDLSQDHRVIWSEANVLS